MSRRFPGGERIGPQQERLRRVAIVGGARTPFARAGGPFHDLTAIELAIHAVDGAIDRLGLDPLLVDELVFGSVIVDPLKPQFAREVNILSDLPPTVRALTVTDNCITGTSAIQSAFNSIATGHSDIGIAGGAESMSNPPLLLGPEASRLRHRARRANSFRDRIVSLAKLRPRHFRPQAYGLVEPSTGLSMGEHTEITVKEWHISREAQDEIAFASHVNASRATSSGRLPEEILPLHDIDRDLQVRPDTNPEVLASLRPVFDRSGAGTITAGNSSPLTDGAAAVILMAEERAEALAYEPVAWIRDIVNVGIDPADGLLMGPGIAVPRLLERNGLTLDDIGIIEMHEAFAGQVLANIAAWENGWKAPPIGRVRREILNPLGSSIAIGHPLAATGARIATTLANELSRQGTRYGLASICGAGGTAAAILLERA